MDSKRFIMRKITKGTWFSPDKRKSVKIIDTLGATYTLKMYNKSTKITQELQVGKEGFNQFIDELHVV